MSDRTVPGGTAPDPLPGDTCSSQSAQAQPGSWAAGGVIVVDDNQAMQQLMAYVMRAAGFRVVTASHGLDALALLRAQPDIQLIISDLDMPLLDGLGLLRQLRHQGGPPILIITARGRKADEEHALELGAAGVLKKPFSRQDLLRAAAPFLVSA